MKTPNNQLKRLIVPFAFTIISLLTISCRECGECKECMYDPNIAQEDWECGAYEEFCGADLESRQSAEIFRCK